MFPSVKMQQPVFFKNRLERDYLLLLEFDKEVLAFQHEPPEIERDLPAIPKRDRPSFYVEGRTSHRLITLLGEQSRSRKDANDWAQIALSLYCLGRGIEYETVQAVELYADSLVKNLTLMHQYSSYGSALDKRLLSRIVDYVRKAGPCTIGETMVAASPDWPQKAVIPVLYLLWQQEITTDLRGQSITTDSLVEVPIGGAPKEVQT